MEDYYCIDIKFKNQEISTSEHHAHLYVSNDDIYIKIFNDEKNLNADRKFSDSDNALGYFEENFDLVKSKTKILFEKSRIWKVVTSSDNFFTIHLTCITIIKKNQNKKQINNGKVFLNENGLKIVSDFYSFFTNLSDKNIFKISRMQGMEDFYNCENFKFRPEFDFRGNDTINSREFTVTKTPIINYFFENESFESVKEKIDIICKFLSFYYGIRVDYTNLHYRTDEDLYLHSNYDKLDHTYNSKISTIHRFLKTNSRIEKILTTNWFEKYIIEKVKIDKAIENYLHSREVDGSAKFLLLFSNIEIFYGKDEPVKVELNELKEENFAKALKLIIESLADINDSKVVENNWQRTINNLTTKPMGSPLENTLIQNGIYAENYGFKFNELKNVRNKLTHGSVSSIDDEKLKEYIYAMSKISISLILSKLGLKDDLKTNL